MPENILGVPAPFYAERQGGMEKIQKKK